MLLASASIWKCKHRNSILHGQGLRAAGIHTQAAPCALLFEDDRHPLIGHAAHLRSGAGAETLTGSLLELELARSQFIGRTEQCCDKSHEPVPSKHQLATNRLVVHAPFMVHFAASPELMTGLTASYPGRPYKHERCFPSPAPWLGVRHQGTYSEPGVGGVLPAFLLSPFVDSIAAFIQRQY